MNKHEQTIAIAKFCGWQFDTYKDSDGEYSFPVGAYWNVIPGYTDDLNAMHEATMTLGIEQLCRMADWLHQITGFHTRIFHATAAQRAEAFLRTIGKWTETNSMRESP